MELKWEILVNVDGGKPENPEKNPPKGENQQRTQPRYDTGPELNPGHMTREKVLSPPPDPCSPKRLSMVSTQCQNNLENYANCCLIEEISSSV